MSKKDVFTVWTMLRRKNFGSRIWFYLKARAVGTTATNRGPVFAEQGGRPAA